MSRSLPVVLLLTLAASSAAWVQPLAAQEDEESPALWSMLYGGATRQNHQPAAGSGRITDYGPLWVSSAPWPHWGGPLAQDLDGDAAAEVIVGFGNGVQAFAADGTLRWKTPEAVSLPELLAAGRTGDGRAVVVQSAGPPSNKVVAYDGEGAVLWTNPPRNDGYGRQGPPLIVPATGELEALVVVGYHGFSYVDRSAPFGFEIYDLATGVLLQRIVTRHHGLGASFGDLDGDGRRELILATTRGDFNATPVATTNAAHGELMRWDRAVQPGPLEGSAPAPFILAWSVEYEGGFWGAHRPPALADLDADGELEIVVLTGSDSVVRVYGSDGTMESQLPWNVRRWHKEMAVSDWDRDGTAEVLVAAANATYAYRWSNDAFHLMWARDFGEEVTGLVIADLDGSGSVEIVVASGKDDFVWYDIGGRQPVSKDAVYPSEHGTLWVLEGSGNALWRSSRTSAILRGLGVADLEGDGRLEILATGQRGRAYVFSQSPSAVPLADLEYASDVAADAVCPRWSRNCDARERAAADGSPNVGTVAGPPDPRPLQKDPLGNEPGDTFSQGTGGAKGREVPTVAAAAAGLAMVAAAVYRRR